MRAGLGFAPVVSILNLFFSFSQIIKEIAVILLSFSFFPLVRFSSLLWWDLCWARSSWNVSNLAEPEQSSSTSLPFSLLCFAPSDFSSTVPSSLSAESPTVRKKTRLSMGFRILIYPAIANADATTSMSQSAEQTKLRWVRLKLYFENQINFDGIIIFMSLISVSQPLLCRMQRTRGT